MSQRSRAQLAFGKARAEACRNDASVQQPGDHQAPSDLAGHRDIGKSGPGGGLCHR